MLLVVLQRGVVDELRELVMVVDPVDEEEVPVPVVLGVLSWVEEEEELCPVR